MRVHLLLCVLVVLAGHAVSAQDKPDFSGDWVLVSPMNADVAQAITVRESFIRESVQGTPLNSPVIRLSVERSFDGNAITRSESFTVGMIGSILGGTLSGQRQQTRVSTTWSGNTLVIDSTTSAVDGSSYSEHQEEWSLDAEGNLLLTTTDPASGTDEPMTRRCVYRQK